MNKISKFRILTGMALAGALFFGSACTDDWDDHYQDKGVNSTLSILEIINNDNELKNFRSVLDACGVTDSLLNQSRVYTLWAPVIDDKTKDSLIARVNEGARDTVMARFVEAHIANYMYVASGNVNDRVRMLNDKVTRFNGSNGEYTFGGMKLIYPESNVRARNGVLHKIDGVAGYTVSIWEYLAEDTRLDSIRKYFYSFDERTFDEYNSIAGPMVNGVQTYIDSVFINSNIWFNRIGYLAREDSTYNIFALTNNVWEKVIPVTTSYFDYYRDKTDTEYYDSLQYQNAREIICQHLVFNNSDQKPEYGDTIRSTYYKKFLREELISGVIDSVELSNGKVYIMDEFKYSPYDLWLDTIKLDAVSETTLSTADHGKQANLQEITVKQTAQNPAVPGNLYFGDYLYAKYVGNNAKPMISYKVPGVLSGKYKIAVVVVPPHITNPNYPAEDIKPSKMRVVVNSRRATGSGTSAVYTTNNGYSQWNGLQNDPTRIDTVYLYDLALDKKNKGDVTKREPAVITFNKCEAGLSDIDDIKTDITIQSYLQRNSDDATWERDLRIDCILLIPVYDEETEEAGE